jgi:hypothetical protein
LVKIAGEAVMNWKYHGLKSNETCPKISKSKIMGAKSTSIKEVGIKDDAYSGTLISYVINSFKYYYLCTYKIR